MNINQRSKSQDFGVKGKSLSQHFKSTQYPDTNKFQKYVENKLKGYLHLRSQQSRSKRAVTMHNSMVKCQSIEGKIKVGKCILFSKRNSVVDLLPTSDEDKSRVIKKSFMFQSQESEIEAEKQFQDSLIYKPIQAKKQHVFQQKVITLPKVDLSRNLQSGLCSRKINIRTYIENKRYGVVVN
ncbi:hypothetical protein pb186bvf_005069 [Paramecium bursaria]